MLTLVIFTALILVLFLSPESYRLRNLVIPSFDGVTPQVLLALFATLLGMSATALVTRFVEHDSWLTLTSDLQKSPKALTLDEFTLRSQWTVSPIARMKYLTAGSSIGLKMVGFALLGLGFLTTVLVSGIDDQDLTETVLQRATNSSAMYEGFAQNFTSSDEDSLGQLAAIISLHNSTAAPATNTPCGSDSMCQINATVGALHGTCTYRSDRRLFSDAPATTRSTLSSTVTASLGVPPPAPGVPIPTPSTIPSDVLRNITITSQTIRKPMTIVLADGRSPAIYGARFYAKAAPLGYTKRARQVVSARPEFPLDGEFGYIMGAFITTEATEINVVNIVECNISWGSTRISQRGSFTPSIDRHAFVPSTESIRQGHIIDNLKAVYSSTFNFSTSGTDFNHPISFTGEAPTIGWIFFGRDNEESISASDVAAKLEAIFDSYTLFAWSRSSKHVYYAHNDREAICLR